MLRIFRKPIQCSFRISLGLALANLPVFTSGCSLFIGNIKPVEEKSEAYRVLDLSRESADWKRLESQSDVSRTDISDLTYQSEKTASIISLNSACRPSWETEPQSLNEFTRQLLLGFSDRTGVQEDDIKLDGQPALQTTLDGKLQGKEVRLRTVVVRNAGCVYDLMYIARPDSFKTQEADFGRFVSSLRLKSQ